MTPRLPRLEVVIRPRGDGDLPLIFDNWQKSFLGVSRAHPEGVGPLAGMRKADYYHEQERVIRGLMCHPGTVVRVACLLEDRDYCVGWVCGDPGACRLDFCYVGALHRLRGVATALVGACFAERGSRRLQLTHWTRVAPYYYAKWGMDYNPYLLHEVLR
jgi:hypothetical protein